LQRRSIEGVEREWTSRDKKPTLSGHKRCF
jgi:hypothetical protein